MTATPSLTAIENKMIAGFISRAERMREIEAIYLFGSRARAEGHSESDIDIAVIVKSKDKIKETTGRVLELAAKVEEETGVEGELLLSPVVLDGPILKSKIGLGKRIREEGIILWSRKSAARKRKAT